jgi:hypothetical protein
MQSDGLGTTGNGSYMNKARKLKATEPGRGLFAAQPSLDRSKPDECKAVSRELVAAG